MPSADPYGNEVYGGTRAEVETKRLSEALTRLNSHLERKIL